VGKEAHTGDAIGWDSMIVEPLAHDELRDNQKSIPSVFYGASTVIRTPASLAPVVGLAPGAQAGSEARLREVTKPRAPACALGRATPCNRLVERFAGRVGSR
jgi:hypothetical protein